MRTTGSSFNIRECSGIRCVGKASDEIGVYRELLKEKTSIEFSINKQDDEKEIKLGLFPGGKLPKGFHGISSDDLKDLGDQGYVLHIDDSGVTAAAVGSAGLFYAVQTLSQIADVKTIVPGVHIKTGRR